MFAAAAVLAAASAAVAEVSTNTAGPVQQGQTSGVNNPAETISLSGTTSFVSYIQSGAISLLSPGTSLTLHNGSGGAPITYYSPANFATSVQLASNNFNAADVGLQEGHARIVERTFEVEKAARVGELVHDDQPVCRVSKRVANEVRTDEAGAAGDDERAQTAAPSGY